MSAHLKDSLFYILLFIFIFYAGFSDAHAKELPIRIGVSAGQTTIKDSSTEQYNVATHVGVIVRADLFSSKSILAGVEGKFTQTATRENVTDLTTTTTSLYEEETRSLFLVARSKGSIYLKAKAGATNRITKTDTEILTDTTKPSAGVALGMTNKAGHIIEFELTMHSEDVSVFSIGYLF